MQFRLLSAKFILDLTLNHILIVSLLSSSFGGEVSFI